MECGSGPRERAGAFESPAAPEPFRRPHGDISMTLNQFAEHVAKSEPVIWIDATPWVSRGRVLRPLSMPHQAKRVSRQAVRSAMRRSGALFSQWSEGWDMDPSEWWYICCDRPDYDVSILRKMPRYDVRKGLQHCDVRRLDGEWFAANGFSVYEAAFRHYGSTPRLSDRQFAAEFRRNAEYPGRETWGAFVEGTLVAWASCIVIDDAVILSSTKSDPLYYRNRPNNALVYVLTRHYLRERQLSYVMSGSRALLHETNVQTFDEKMGYRRVFCQLRTELRPSLSIADALALSVWARRLGLGKILKVPLAKLDAVGEAVRISRDCERHASATEAPGPSASKQT